MATIYAWVSAVIAALVLVSCGGKTDNGSNTPPPLPSDNFSGIYKAVGRMDTDSMLFYSIHAAGRQFYVDRYTYIVKDSSLHGYGQVKEVFLFESDHRIVANGGYASISFQPHDSIVWYVNKPDNYRLKKIGEYSAQTNNATGVFTLLKQKHIIGH